MRRLREREISRKKKVSLGFFITTTNFFVYLLNIWAVLGPARAGRAAHTQPALSLSTLVYSSFLSSCLCPVWQSDEGGRRCCDLCRPPEFGGFPL